MSTDVAELVEIGQLSRQTAFWVDLAQHVEITDQASCETAAAHLSAIGELQREADRTFDPIIKKQHEAHKEALAQKKRVCQPLTDAEQIIKGKLSAWTQEQQRIRFEQERLAREAAELEAAHQREAELEAAEAAGATVQEIAVMAEEPLIRKPVVVAAPPKPVGFTAREQWKAEVTDLEALIKYVAGRPELSNLLLPNMPAINALARSMRSALRIPGVRVDNPLNIAKVTTLRKSS